MNKGFILTLTVVLIIAASFYPIATASSQTSDNDAGAHNKSVSCPADMVEIEGEYCPNLQIKCLYNLDMEGKRKPGPGNLEYACGEYKYPTVCLSRSTVHMHFCMDRYEWPNRLGQKPKDWMTFIDAKKETAAVGKRLCTAREWTLAAEGPERHPLPYGDGYHRDNSICNFDRRFTEVKNFPDNFGVKSIDVFQSRRPDDAMSQLLRQYLVPSGSMPGCHSDYGVYDMAGNLDELVVNEGGDPCLKKTTGNCISGLKGGHVWHVRNASRPITTIHGPTFGWYEVSTRACTDISK